jgi:AraC-like DNA-binding protein
MNDIEYGYQLVGLEGDARYRAFLHGPREIPFHWHPELEIVAVLRGTVNLAVAGQQCMMTQGDLMIVNANVMHNSMAWSADAVVYGIHIDAEHFGRNGLPGFGDRFFLCKSFLHGRPFEKVARPIKALLARIVLNSAEHQEEAMVRHILAHLLCYYIYRRIEWVDPSQSRSGFSNSGRERVTAIMRKVRTSANTNLGQIAEDEGLTLSHLSRLFKSCVGIGFRDYVQNIRLDHAVLELRTTRRTIAEVMERAGYSNPTHFFAKFRERFGLSPAEYRRQQKWTVGSADIPKEDQPAIAALLRAEIEHASEAFDLLKAIPASGEARYHFAAPHNLVLPAADLHQDEVA